MTTQPIRTLMDAYTASCYKNPPLKEGEEDPMYKPTDTVASVIETLKALQDGRKVDAPITIPRTVFDNLQRLITENNLPYAITVEPKKPKKDDGVYFPPDKRKRADELLEKSKSSGISKQEEREYKEIERNAIPFVGIVLKPVEKVEFTGLEGVLLMPSNHGDPVVAKRENELGEFLRSQYIAAGIKNADKQIIDNIYHNRRELAAILEPQKNAEFKFQLPFQAVDSAKPIREALKTQLEKMMKKEGDDRPVQVVSSGSVSLSIKISYDTRNLGNIETGEKVALVEGGVGSKGKSTR